ncbi:hypothetical protein MRB53_020394 [Persea americana]|uniref:Uncharacterized protein n=1 Tax=Persea americana TaxID=3435 RepID=A0ACC2L0S7_PERAE|nr:hypothetical protein MRB53_020394 [Persea americana]
MSEAGSPFVMFFGQVCLIFLWYLQVYPRFSFATKNALDLFAKNPIWVSSSFLLFSMPLSRAIRRDVRNNKIDETFERLVLLLEEDKKEEERRAEERKEEARKEEERKRGPTMQECIDILKQMPNIQATSELYFFGTRAFKDLDNRDIFMSFESNDARLYWLNMIVKHGP